MKRTWKLRALSRDVAAAVIATAPTRAAAARTLGVSQVTVFRWLRTGQLGMPTEQQRKNAQQLRKYSKTCVQCGSPFIIEATSAGHIKTHRRCCSKACFRERMSQLGRRSPRLRTCVVCGMQFNKKINGGKGLCCTRSCGYAFLAWQGCLRRNETRRARANRTKPCKHCGIEVSTRTQLCEACKEQNAVTRYREWYARISKDRHDQWVQDLKAQPERICPCCGASFKPKRVGNAEVFCSKRCSKRLNKRLPMAWQLLPAGPVRDELARTTAALKQVRVWLGTGRSNKGDSAHGNSQSHEATITE